MTNGQMLEELKAAADPSLADYQKRIVCDSEYPMLFVRMPRIRRIAKAASKGDWTGLIRDCGFSWYEEVLTVCLAAAYADAPLEQRLAALKNVIPRLDSWGMTDSIVPTLKVKADELEAAWDFAQWCIRCREEYTRRFGIVMLLNFFLTPEYIPAVEKCVASIRDTRYYVRMACAWLFAEMAVHDWARVEVLLAGSELDEFVHNMTIRKIRESLRISGEVKAVAAAWKRKDRNDV